MKFSIWISAGAALATIGTTQAQAGSSDDGVPYAAVENWAGFYIGGAGGFGVMNSGLNADIKVGTPTFSIAGLPPISSPLLTSLISSRLSAIPASYSATYTNDHTLGAVIAGYNWQRGNQVYGIEADATFPNGNSFAGVVRARYGLAAGNWLFYGTAGLSFSEGVSAGTEPTPVSGVTWHYDGFNSVGFVAGGGVERKVADHWVAGLEALYYGFSDCSQNVSVNYSTAQSVLGVPVTVNVPVNATVRTSADAFSVHARLTYKFDW